MISSRTVLVPFCFFICTTIVLRQTFLVTYVNMLILTTFLIFAIPSRRFTYDFLNRSGVFVPFVFFLCFLLVEFISASFSILPFKSFASVLKELVFFIVFIFLLSLLSKRKSNLDIFFVFLKYAVYFVIASIIFEFFLLIVSSQYEASERLTGIYGNASAPGHFLAVAVPVLVAYSKNKNSQYPFVFVFLVYFALALTMSRSGLLGVTIALVLLQTSSYSRLMIKMSIFALITILVIISLPASFLDFFATVMRIENGLSGRDELWEVGAKVYNHSPLIGIGPSLFRYYFLQSNNPLADVEIINNIINNYFATGSYSGYPGSVFGGIIGNSTHNLYFDVLVGSGALGLFFFLIFLGGLFYKIFKFSSLNKTCILTRSSLAVFISLLFRFNFEPNGLLKGGFSEVFVVWFVLFLPFVLKFYHKRG